MWIIEYLSLVLKAVALVAVLVIAIYTVIGFMAYSSVTGKQRALLVLVELFMAVFVTMLVIKILVL